MFLTLRAEDGAESQLGETPCTSLDQAYLDICAAIPDAVAELMRQRRDPFTYAFVLTDEAGAEIIEVPLSELLPGTAGRRGSPAPDLEPGRGDRLADAIRRGKRLSAEAAALQRRARRACLSSHELIARTRKLSAGVIDEQVLPFGARSVRADLSVA